MSRSRKDTRPEGEPEGKDDSAVSRRSSLDSVSDLKDDSSVSRRSSIDLADIEGLSDEEILEPGAPEVETKDEPDHKPEPENKSEDDIEEDLVCPVTQAIFLHPVTMIHPASPTVEREVAQWYVDNNYEKKVMD
jgi:hypothetical protein